MKFRKKPIVIEAIQFNNNFSELEKFVGKEGRSVVGDTGPWFAIYTLEGVMRAEPGDWVIKGIAGEFYPCKPDIFAATYELAEPVVER
jgi:hypothetical protein